MTATIDSSSLADAVRTYYTEVADNATQALLLDIERDAPRRTGAMVDHITLAEDDEATRIVRRLRAPEPYSSFVDEGTRPHEIRGNPLLSFVWQGQRVIVHSVQHPGTQRTGWWTDTLARWTDYVRDAMR